MKRFGWLLPLMLIYAIVVIHYAQEGHGLRIDESRYVGVARSFMDGTRFSRTGPRLWSGPGYPLVLAPFIGLQLPWIIPRLSNVVFLFIAMVYLLLLLRSYVPPMRAYIAVYCVGLQPVLLEYLPRLMTEQISMLLVSGFAYHFSRVYRGNRWVLINGAIASAYLGYLALTKVLFGYVIATCIVVYSLGLILTRRRMLVRSIAVYGLAMLLCLPYLVYTHSRTGKFFYWATSGGMSLYWMSNTVEGEYGDWLGGTRPLQKRERARNHLEFLDSLKDLTRVEQDRILKEQAIKNIVGHPGKFARNWVSNLGRLFCDYPFSYREQTPASYLKLIPGVLLAFFLGLSLISSSRRRASIPYEIRSLTLLGLVYIGGSSLLSAYNRMLLPVTPLLALWITVSMTRLPVSGRDV